MDKRQFSRVGFAAEAEIKWHGKAFRGGVGNLSLHGMLVKSPASIDVGEEVGITLFLTGITPEISVNLNGVVVRVEPAGIGVDFREMDSDSFVHLRKIVTYNLGDDTKVMDEFATFIRQKGE